MAPVVQLSAKSHKIVHWIMTVAALVLVAKDDLAKAVGYLPEGVPWSKYLGWVLAMAAFTRVIAQRVDTTVGEPAAPVNVVPISEAITTVDKPGAVQKDK